MVLDGPGRDKQPVGDLRVRKTLGEKLEYFRLPSGEPAGVGTGLAAPTPRYAYSLAAKSLPELGCDSSRPECLEDFTSVHHQPGKAFS